MRLVHSIALESGGGLTVTAVDVSTRPELIRQFGAATVPYYVVNRQHGFPGPLPELILLQRIADLVIGEPTPPKGAD